MFESKPDPLDYVFPDSPQVGTKLEVAKDVYWVRMPMPGRLDHINVWLLRDYDGWTIVETGLNNAAIKSAWENIFEN